MYRKFFQKLRYKYKLLISMIAVFFVPCIFIGSIFVSKIRNEETKNEIAVSGQLFQQASHNICMVFGEIQRMSYELLSDKNLKSGSYPMKNSDKMRICSNVDNYLLNSQYLAELILYEGDENLLFYSEGTIRPDLYFQRVNQYAEFDLEEFYGLAENLTKHLAIVDMVKNMWVSDQREMLTVFVPLKSSGFRLAAFVVDMGNITDIADELAGKDHDILNLYYNKRLIYSNDSKKISNNDSRILEMEELPFEEGSEKAENLKTSVEGNRLAMLYTPEDSAAQIFMQRNLLGQDFSASGLSSMYLFVSLLFMLLGCMVVVFIWRESYKPVGEILEYFPEANAQKNNEFDIVKNTLLSIQSEKEKMSQNLSDSFPAYKKHLLMSLIKGEFNSLEEFNTRGRVAGIVYQNRNLFILAVSIVDGDQPVQFRKTVILEKILSQSEENMPENMILHGFVDMMNEKIIYVANTDWETQEELDNALTEFQKELRESIGFDLNMGCSNLYQVIEDMPKAYMEALSALDYRIVYGYGKIIYFSQIGLNYYSHNWYPEELTRQFGIALKMRNEEQVHAILDEIMEFLHRENTPVYVAKYVCYDLMQMLADSLTVAKSLPYKKTIGYHNIMNIARLTTFEQITEVLHQNVSHVLSIDVKEEIENSNLELKQRLEKFIEEHYADSSFSMTSLVEEFGFSESTMRKNFKAVMQTTFVEYLAEKRIAKSKELLSTTDLPLSQIARQVGYLDTSSFIRRFRQKTGMPPGEYRILQKTK